MTVFSPSYNGVGDVNATFLSALVRGTDEDKPVKVSDNKTVSLPADNDQFVGVVSVIDPHDSGATVKVRGFVTVPYTGTAPAVGETTLVSDGAGAVKEIAAAAGIRVYQVADVDTTNLKLTFLL